MSTVRSAAVVARFVMTAFLCVSVLGGLSKSAAQTPPVDFTRHLIDYRFLRMGDLVVVDFDDDGDRDVIAYELEAGRLVLNENQGGRHSSLCRFPFCS